MSRLHAAAATATAIARYMGVDPVPTISLPIETTEGRPGVAVFEGGGRRQLRCMTWGFPWITLSTPEGGQEPGRVGLVADLTNPMWDGLVADPRYRCLVPITHFANPDGETGAKTRTWFTVRDRPIVAWAGFCRNLPGHGPVYAGMTTEANRAIPPTNDRMPVLIEPDEHERWLHGSIQDVIGFQFRDPLDAARMVIERTEDRWRSGNGPPRPAKSTPMPALL